MKEKHPIDKIFRDGLDNADIPFDEGAWTTLSRKMHPSKRWPLIIGVGSGIAAAIIIAVLLPFGNRELDVARPGQDIAAQQPVVPKQPIAPTPIMPSEAEDTVWRTQSTSANTVSVQSTQTSTGDTEPTNRSPALAHVQLQRPASATLQSHLHHGPPDIAGMRSAPTALPAMEPMERRPTTANEPDKDGWTLGIVAAPDVSGTHPFGGRFSGHLGLMATYHFRGRLSVSAAILYAKKRYQADFADYHSVGGPLYAQYTPTTVNADCNVLDIPVNIRFDIARKRRATWFASTGVSSYLMLKERYDYTYPPHQYGDVKQLTLHHANRHIFGIANLSVGYRRQVSSKLSITVQPFVKVPLTGIGNGRLKLYSSGVALSADVDLSRRTKRQ